MALFLRVWAQSGKLPSGARQNQATGILPEQAQSSEKEKELTSGKPGVFRESRRKDGGGGGIFGPKDMTELLNNYK